MINALDFDDNSDLFSSLYKQVCGRSRETGLPTGVILCQMIYQASYEIILGGELPLDMITGIVEAAADEVAVNSQAEDAQGGDQ
ncbi:hypothetical protein [Pseudomonas juntendi]|uniref:hypothetical protein n=1 Tax=Pseudomonas juntendi TaxID=2666183 RepID=UPI001E4B0AB6|nr:hypothetical protein [Pseudomonas juntendi]MDM3891445.1 hypothetical protein [Pseudomonas juntendi]